MLPSKFVCLSLVSNSAIKHADTDKDNHNVPDEELALISSINKKVIILSLLDNLRGHSILKLDCSCNLDYTDL